MYFNAQETRIPGLETTSHGWVSTYPLSQNAGRVTRAGSQFIRCLKMRVGSQDVSVISVSDSILGPSRQGNLRVCQVNCYPSEPLVGRTPRSARDPLIALLTNKISSAPRVQADPGIGRGPGGRPTFHVDVDFHLQAKPPAPLDL